MTATITLYKLHSGFSNISNDWSLQAIHADEYRGDYAKLFALPEGYRAGETTLGEPGIFNASGQFCDVSITDAGAPCVLDYPRAIPLVAA